MRDFENNLRFDQVLDPQTVTSDKNGGVIDMQGYRYLAFYALLGESGDTLSPTVYIELELEESADNSTFTDVADSDMANTVTGTNDGCFGLINAPSEDGGIYMTEYKGSKRYVRPVVNVTGTHSSGTPIGIIAFRSGDASLPITQAT